jgi:hypothetical protein
MPHPNRPELPRIAVVGVHGVNTNEPFQTARTMAKMLLKRDPREEKYSEFREIAGHILVEPLRTYGSDSGGPSSKEWSVLDERPRSILRAHRESKGKEDAEEPPVDKK